MTNKQKQREEPKLRIEDLENELNATPKKQWPKEEDFNDNEDGDDNESEPQQTAALTHPSYEELEKKLTEAERKAEDYLNQQLRAKAELDNMRRRAQRDVDSIHKFALEDFAKALLPVADSLNHALLSDVSDNDYAKKMHEGIELTMALLLKTLAKFGIEQVDPAEQAFNPELHQAIATRPSETLPANYVLEVLQKGYTLNGRLIRPALVVVAA